jgi:hypothetical protein
MLIYAGLIDKPNSSMDFMSVFPIKSGSIRDLGRPESFWSRSGVVLAIVTAIGVLGGLFPGSAGGNMARWIRGSAAATPLDEMRAATWIGMP